MTSKLKLCALAAILAASAATQVAAKGANGLLDSPILTPMARFETLILEQAGGDAKAAVVMKEQWAAMYNSLQPSAQAAIYGKLVAADERGFMKVMRGDLPTALGAQGKVQMNQTLTNDKQKLAASDNEYVFVPTAPCRLSDTRSWGLGAVLPFRTRQFWGWANSAGYGYSEQGGTGTSGSGECSATVFNPATPPIAAMITIVAIAGAAPGDFRAWNGGTSIPAASMINFTAGAVLANTTVIPLSRTVPVYATANDNSKRDFAIYNESAAPVHVIADVVGYFIKPLSYNLACTYTDGTPVVSTSTGFKSASAPACAVGTSLTGVLCSMSASSGGNLQSSGYSSPPACEWGMTSATSNTLTARAVCCTLP